MKTPLRPCDREVLMSGQQLGEAVYEYLLSRGLVRGGAATTATQFIENGPEAATARVRVWYGPPEEPTK